MDLQQDATQKTEKSVKKLLSFTMQAAKLTEEVFKTMLSKAAKDREPHISKDKYSTTSVAAMAAKGGELTVINEGMLPDVAKRFYKYAGKKGIPFTMLQDKSTNPPTFHLCIYKGQEGVFRNLVKNFLKEEAQRKSKPSLRKKLHEKVKEAKEKYNEWQEKRKSRDKDR